MIELTDGIDDAQAAFERCVAGEPAVGFAEIYTQTGFDPSPAPEGKHLMTRSASTRRTSSPTATGTPAATTSRGSSST